jgi:hypothetical protein
LKTGLPARDDGRCSTGSPVASGRSCPPPVFDRSVPTVTFLGKPLKRKTIALACARNEPQVKLVTCILSVHSFMVDKSAPHLIIGVADGTADLRRAGE